MSKLIQTKEKANIINCCILCYSVIIMQWFSIEYSISNMHTIFSRSASSNLLGISIVVIFNTILILLIKRIGATLYSSSVMCSAFSILNVSVLSLHGSPIRASEIGNIGTALHVLGGYEVSIEKKQILIFAFFLIEIAFIYFFKRLCTIDRIKVRVSGLMLITFFVIASVFWKNPNSSPIIGFSWTFSADQYGYAPCLVKDATIFVSKVEKPNNYNEAELDRIDKEENTTKRDIQKPFPDIILILNETLYDPACFKEIALETDKEYLNYYNGMPKDNRGSAVVPYTGTNSTEYELLTSNSKQLVNPSAPFVYYDLSEANSVVRYLKTLGYETWAMHNAEAENYNRKAAYKDIGFDHIMFYEDMLPDDVYGNRRGTDLNDYGDITKEYEKGGEDPRFIYMLTIQNHGGYEQNDSDMDTVHCLNDYGDYTDDMDEFLTSISKSDEALEYLINYFSNVDRRVIVAVLGDHPPSFVFSWSNETLSKDGNVKEYVKRNTTPLLIWSNYSEAGIENRFITASDIVPKILEIGGCPLSKYYSQLLKVQSETPIHMGEYVIDCNDRIIKENELDDYAINDYLKMEYNNLQKNTEDKNGLNLS